MPNTAQSSSEFLGYSSSAPTFSSTVGDLK
jgi:hypothetical protein